MPSIPLPFIKVENAQQKIVFNPSSINIPFGIKKNFDYKLGLDLEGGTRLEYKVEMKDVPSDQRDAAFESARNIIEKRVNPLGVTEPIIQSLKVSNEYRFVIELPGASDVARAANLIGQTAQLTFWEEGNETFATSEASMYPLGLSFFFQNKPIKTSLTGKDLKSATVEFGSGKGTPEVGLNFTDKGGKLFAEITKRNVGKPVAIVLDNEVITAPNVQQEILGGTAVISGNFTTEQAKNLKIQLNSGALPAPLILIAEKTVPPSLGIQSLRESLIGGILGLITVIIFMLLLYKKEGFLASIALLIYAIIVLFIFKAIPITLTLAGIAGFILSVGMAVDANILIFERMKEELRAGKSKKVAQKLGFTRAWPSIRDSNVSSLITTFILYEFGTSIVKGFAVTLFIGIIVSMFSAIIVTRNLLVIFDREKI